MGTFQKYFAHIHLRYYKRKYIPKNLKLLLTTPDFTKAFSFPFKQNPTREVEEKGLRARIMPKTGR